MGFRIWLYIGGIFRWNELVFNFVECRPTSKINGLVRGQCQTNITNCSVLLLTPFRMQSITLRFVSCAYNHKRQDKEAA